MRSTKNTELSKIIKTEFLINTDIQYLNHAAISPWPRRTANAVKHFADENVQFGATHYSDWLALEAKLKRQLQSLIHAPSADDIALLKNTSEALSVVAGGIDWHAKDNVVSTDEEFPSNRIVWQAQAKHGVELRQIAVTPSDNPESALIEACDENTRVLAVSSVQYGTGLRLDLVKLGNFCRAQDIYFCIDAIQSIAAYQFDVQAVKADFVMADAHKWMCGPEGIAFFYCRAELRERLCLNQFGWHMVDDHMNYNVKTWCPANNARRFECGSPNMLGIYALSASLSLFDEIGMDKVEDQLVDNVSYLIDSLNNFKDIRFLSPIEKTRRSGIVNFKIIKKDMAQIHNDLMEKNVLCAHRINGIRFSPHFYTDLNVINRSLEILSLCI